MMSSGNNSRAEAPFGYTFEIPNPSNTAPSYPAPGPPLLDNNESGILETFFDNPNNVDPSFLSVSSNFQGDHSALFGLSGALDWMGHGMNAQASSDSPTGRSISQSNPARQTASAFNPRIDLSNSVAASDDDVYAAARLLHNNQVGRFGNMAGQYNGYPHMSSGGHTMSSSNGYGYPPIPSPHATPYNFNSASTGHSLYNLGDFQSQYNGNEQTTSRGIDNRDSSIRFGTDSSFRNSYSGTSLDPQEKEAADGFAQLYQVAQAGMGEAAKAVLDAGQRKRPRAVSEVKEVTGDSEEDHSSEDEHASSKKRRKSNVKDEEDADFGERVANGRRKSSSVQKSRGQKSGQVGTASPSKKSKQLPSASKAQRDNLTEEQKRSNHIQSEQKRRNLIKQGFEDLNRLVPELRAGGFSKSNMLVEAAKFMARLQAENDELRAHMRSLDNG